MEFSDEKQAAIDSAYTSTKSSHSYVSLLNNDQFLPGIVVLVKTLRRSSSIPIHVMVTKCVSAATLTRLRGICDGIIEVDSIACPDDATSDASWASSELTKLNIWNLVQFDKVVYIDADALVLESIDELFLLPSQFAAAPDVFPPDKFNAGKTKRREREVFENLPSIIHVLPIGVLVVKPDENVFKRMTDQIGVLESHDGGDTGFLNSFFPNWYEGDSTVRLPFGYNAQRTLYWFTYKKRPGYWNSIKPLKLNSIRLLKVVDNLKLSQIIHFSSSPKPWETGMSGKSIGDLEFMWWQEYMS